MVREDLLGLLQGWVGAHCTRRGSHVPGSGPSSARLQGHHGARQRPTAYRVAALQRAVKSDPAQPDAHSRLAHVYQDMGKAAESQKEFAKVRQLHEKADESVASKMSATPPPLPQ